jgi:hypothetical protein
MSAPTFSQAGEWVDTAFPILTSSGAVIGFANRVLSDSGGGLGEGALWIYTPERGTRRIGPASLASPFDSRFDTTTLVFYTEQGDVGGHTLRWLSEEFIPWYWDNTAQQLFLFDDTQPEPAIAFLHGISPEGVVYGLTAIPPNEAPSVQHFFRWKPGQPVVTMGSLLEEPLTSRVVRGPGVLLRYNDQLGFITRLPRFSAPANDDMVCIVGAPCDDIDFNRDGLFPDETDLVAFLSVLAGAPCPTPRCGDLDFNNDTLFPDEADLIAYVSRLAGGTCP